ncbi:MAG: tail fiber domain-containing protein [Dyadobacter sp.]|uniref:tail fiber domain-containing protein n=1 Tax=Dyadobacter sp. TaxID=1914288 RepID=UPI0032637EC0
MKQLYKTAGALMMIACSVNQVNAQTQFGAGAGATGVGRAFFGTDAGKVNTGSFNTFLGHESGSKNTSGQNNSFMGFRSGYSNTTGAANTFVGTYAGALNFEGDANTFMGRSAGESNTSGMNNTFLGHFAGFFNKIGGDNVAIGTAAGYSNSASGNVVVGGRAGFKNTSSFNTFIGLESGYENFTGTENTFLGHVAGYLNTSGQLNTFIGSESGHSNIVGIANAFLGNKAGYNNTGSNNAFFGYGAGYDNVFGEKNTYLGYASGGSAGLINATAIGANTKVTADNSLVLGNGSNVGIGISAPTYQLHLSTSSAAKLGSSSWTIWSDKRLKKDISDFTDGLDLLKQIKPVKFRYNGEAGTKSDKQFVGIIAQDMQKIAPYTIGSSVCQDSLGNKTEYLDYDANAVTYILINSVKEQQELIDQKEAKIQEISAQVTELSKRLEQLERIIASGPLKPVGNPAAKLGNEPNENGVVLEQNAPNGFSQTTLINFFIPQTVKDAVVNIYSTDGAKVGSYPVTDRGQSALKLSAKTFRSGVFIYDLVTDGKSNGAKKMVVTE